MIFLGFVLVNAILLLCALLAGDIGTIYNFDSIFIIIVGLTISILMLFLGRFKIFFRGIHDVLSFKAHNDKSDEVARAFTGLSLIIVGIGLLSTIQGIYSGLLMNPSPEIEKVFLLSFFTTAYSLDIVVLLFIPIIYKNK